MKLTRIRPRGVLVLLVLAGTLSPVATLSLVQAQTLAEVTTVAAISLELNPAVRLPSGSLRAVGEGADALIARVPGHEAFTDWEVYTATGVVANLQPAFVQQITTSFAVNGYFLAEQKEETKDGETHARYTYQNELGQATLLYVIRGPQGLIWLVAKSKA